MTPKRNPILIDSATVRDVLPSDYELVGRVLHAGWSIRRNLRDISSRYHDGWRHSEPGTIYFLPASYVSPGYMAEAFIAMGPLPAYAVGLYEAWRRATCALFAC